jgi:hypothetical protein
MFEHTDLKEVFINSILVAVAPLVALCYFILVCLLSHQIFKLMWELLPL